MLAACCHAGFGMHNRLHLGSQLHLGSCRLMKIFGQVFLVMSATPLTEIPSLKSLTKPTLSLHIVHLENKEKSISLQPHMPL